MSQAAGSAIELIRPPGARKFAWALFDFDGTISLIRAGWQAVMADMMLEELRPLRHGLGEPELGALVMEDITALTGEQTIYQMIRLAERVRQFSAEPAEPLEYKRRYNDRLMAHIADRLSALRSGRRRPDELMLPGARAFLEALKVRGLCLLLTSGTDEPYVRQEAGLLAVDRYFDGGIHGARDDYRTHTKAKVIERTMRERGIDGASLLGVGDGFVEIANTRQAGGYAVGVASDEAGAGAVNCWKRRRLIDAGADAIVADFTGLTDILAAIFPEKGRT